ncbi:myosin-9-like [Bombina bombina]|uniref:myosin-9-like n=1 Tax=Bombina bombina TaxID=8345 RepID=UPI00235B1D17|nr:myosin-9-like [Bombina bombina]
MAEHEKEERGEEIKPVLQEHIKFHEDIEAKLVEKRSEFLKLQTALHQLEERYLATTHSVQDQIGSELRKEAEKLRYQLKEKQLSADEDKYMRNKMGEDCARLTKENGLLHSQVLETTKQLEKERQLREEENMSRTKWISELTVGKERERQLEQILPHLKRLVQDEKQKVISAQEQMLHVQQGRKSVEMNGQAMRGQLTDLEKRLSRVQLENSQLRIAKTHLVEHISQLHKEIAEKDDEVRRMQGHVDSLCLDMNSLQFRGDMADSSQKEAWKQLSSITQGVHKIAAAMSMK